jgi:hypothetical protein
MHKFLWRIKTSSNGEIVASTATIGQAEEIKSLLKSTCLNQGHLLQSICTGFPRYSAKTGRCILRLVTYKRCALNACMHVCVSEQWTYASVTPVDNRSNRFLASKDIMIWTLLTTITLMINVINPRWHPFLKNTFQYPWGSKGPPLF